MVQLLVYVKFIFDSSLLYSFRNKKSLYHYHYCYYVAKVARLCCPVQVQQLKPDAAALEEFSNFPFVNENTIANLANELPDYLAAADGVTLSNENEKVTWWAAHAVNPAKLCCC